MKKDQSNIQQLAFILAILLQINFLKAQSITTGCDTLHNFSSSVSLINKRVGPLTSDGYVTGQNKYKDIGKAERYDYPSTGFSKGLAISGVRVRHAVIKGTGSTAYTIWGETANSPSVVLGSQSVVNNLFAPNSINTILFSTPITISNNTPFYAGYAFGNVAGDTIAVYQTPFGTTTTNHAYEQFSNGTWGAFNSPTTGWGLGTACLMVWPIVCSNNTAGILDINQNLINNVYLYPNPNNGIIKVMLIFDESTDVSITVNDILGKEIMTNRVEQVLNKEISLNMTKEIAGTYFVTIKTTYGLCTKRISIN